MAIILQGRTRSFRTTGSNPITKISVNIAAISPKQRVLPASGITDVVSGVLIEPISIKYPGLGLMRWVGANGAIQGVEANIEFKETEFFPPNSTCTGFEIYVIKGTVFDVTIDSEAGSMDLTDYYTKDEVDALIASLPPSVDAYTKAQMDTLLALKQGAGSYYTQSQVDALIPITFRSFDYDQVAVPSAPTNGQTWRERDSSNNLVMDWFYNSALSKWQSIELKRLTGFYNYLVNSSDSPLSGFEVNDSYGIRLKSFNVNYIITSSNSGTNYWNFELYSQVFSATYSVGLTSQNLASDVLTKASVSLNILIGANENKGFNFVAQKIGSPGSLRCSAVVTYRHER